LKQVPAAVTLASIRCLILACGNTLRGDDGVGPWLAAWAEERFGGEAAVRVVARQQWTPDLAEEVAQAEAVLFLDCALDSAPGEVHTTTVEAAAASSALATHHVGAAELLALSEELYGSLPRNALLLTVGAGSMELREEFSAAVIRALPEAVDVLEKTVRRLLKTT
jgi:hydrogenase maturation protease